MHPNVTCLALIAKQPSGFLLQAPGHDPTHYLPCTKEKPGTRRLSDSTTVHLSPPQSVQDDLPGDNPGYSEGIGTAYRGLS